MFIRQHVANFACAVLDDRAEFANEDRYRAARNMLALYGDVLTASELRNDYNEPIIRLQLREAMK